MNSLLKELMPPIIYRTLEKIKKGNEFKSYLSYQEALKFCTTDSYEQHELIEVIFKKTQRFTNKINSEIIAIGETSAYNLISMINPVIENHSKQINVLDFGGACGAHYFQLRHLIDKNLRINWVVVETPAMVAQAKALETDELSFYSNFNEAIEKLGTVDLLHTSGTLQCVDAPLMYLEKILNCNAKWLLFNRLGLNKIDRDAITIHASKLSWNGIGELPEGYTDKLIKYPFTFISEKVFLEKVQNKYSLVAKFLDQSGMKVIKGEEIVGYGLLCKNIN